MMTEMESVGNILRKLITQPYINFKRIWGARLEAESPVRRYSNSTSEK